MVERVRQKRISKTVLVVSVLVAVLCVSVQDVWAFETGEKFIPDNLASRLMRRYEKMGNNEHITYPARVYGESVTNAQAEAFLKTLSEALTSITESMYNHYGFMVKSVTLELVAKDQGASTVGDPMPMNIEVGRWWGIRYSSNYFCFPTSWAKDPTPVSQPLFHEFGHTFLLRHLDLNDGYFPRSVMDTPGYDGPSKYCMWGGDDLAGAIHMWRYTKDPSTTPKNPELYTHETVGVIPSNYPDGGPYPEGTWRCDAERKDILGIPLRNREYDRCLEVSNSTDGTPASLSGYTGINSQVWDLIANTDGSYQIVNTSTNKCLAVRGKSHESGAVIEQQPCNKADATDATQKFYIIPAGDGYYSIRSELSGRFLGVVDDEVLQVTHDGSHAQRWSMEASITAIKDQKVSSSGIALMVEGNHLNYSVSPTLSGSDLTIDLFALNGKHLFSLKRNGINSGTYTLDLSNGRTSLASGMYIAKMHCGDRVLKNSVLLR